tara:strand:- start:209 stop:382 length:174 start_codon:yes stop_codon:yes gene_type:complete
MEWIAIADELPEEQGKYIVKTKTMMGNQNRFDARLYISGSKKTWDVSNQVVTHWLKE